MKQLATIALFVAFAACGGNKPAATTPVDPAGDSADGADNHETDLAQRACFETCVETGPASGAPDGWDAMDLTQRGEVCEPACRHAGDEAAEAQH